jgi:hypothetical protein
MMSGLAAEQIANDPAGRTFADQTRRAVHYLVNELRAERRSPTSTSKRTAARR